MENLYEKLGVIPQDKLNQTIEYNFEKFKKIAYELYRVVNQSINPSV